MRTKGRRTLHNLNGNGLSSNRSVEISFLGGLASIRLGKPENPTLETVSKPSCFQIEAPKAKITKGLAELTSIYEKKLITLEEFNQAKKDLFKNS
jgi:hypothetical protein